MTAKLDYQWRLREIMASHNMFSTTDLKPLLAERGVQYSTSQIYRLVTEKPERLSLPTLMALMDIFGCRMDDLIEPVAATARTRTKKAAGQRGASASIGAARPKRARVLE